jgi:hypothetical protein
VHGNSQIGNTYINTDIALTGDLSIIGEFNLNGGSHNLSLQDWHGITAWLWLSNGIATLSWSNTFLKTRGYVSVFTVTWSLDHFFFDGKPSNTPSSNPSYDFHLFQSDISAKNIDILSGALIELHVSSPRNTLHAQESLHIQKGWSLLIQTPLTIAWDILNEWAITWGATFFISGDIENLWIWSAITHIHWPSFPWATEYNLQFSPGIASGVTLSNPFYNITDKISGKYFWQVTPNTGASYSLRCINQGCVTGAPPKSALSFLSSVPTAFATGVLVDSLITLNFSNPLDQTAVPGNIVLRKTNGDIVNTVALSYSGNSIIFGSISPLSKNTSYTVELKMGLKDIYGNTLESPASFSFTTITTTTISPPTDLQQQIQSPYMTTLDSVGFWEKIGKFQSWTGIILSANIKNDANNLVRLVFDIYRTWGDSLIKSFATEYEATSWTRSIIVPYLWVWSYYWKVRMEDNQWNSSQSVSAWIDNTSLPDFILYDGFEPYPHGYKFANSSPANGILNGWIGQNHWTGERYKIDWNKWEIFNKTFPESSFTNRNAMFDFFEILWMTESKPFQWWNCFGMATSSATHYAYPYLFQQHFPSFSAKVWTGTVWDDISELRVNSNKNWDFYDDTLETILKFQLMQYDYRQHTKITNYTGIINVYDTIQNNPRKTYILSFWWTGSQNESVWHTVIPYKLESLPESKRIYVWDSNYPFTWGNILPRADGYNQYIEIYNNGKWKNRLYYDWKSFDRISLVSLNEIYEGIDQFYNLFNQILPIWFNDYDMLATLNWSSDFIITDSVGRISGFSGWTIIEEIPWMHIILPLNATLTGSPNNTWKQIYLPRKQDWLTIKVVGKTKEPYDLMIAWWEYYTKVSGVTTDTGQLDSYQVTWTGTIIDFDNQKTGDYSLLTDNFQDTLTWTVFLTGMIATPSLQKISYDWNKVIQKKGDAISYQIDINNDGIYDLASNFPAIPTSPKAKWSISGYVIWDTNVNITSWKIILQKQSSDLLCREDQREWEKWDSSNYQKKQESRECREYEKDDKNQKNNKNDNDHEDRDNNKLLFAITDKKWYYTFNNLSSWSYSVSIEPQKNWSILKPQNYIYNLTLSSWQNIINLNFETTFLKGKNK